MFLLSIQNVLVNPGSAYSEPVIVVNGSGDITLIINGEFIELTDIEGGITLNSEILEAYHADTLMNEHMDGEFPLLKPGNNLISWSGDVTSLVIQPNWRYLV